MSQSEKEYFTLKEVAEHAGTSYGIVKRDIDKGKLPAYRVGRKYFIAKQEMDKYLAQTREKQDIEGYSVKEIMEQIPLSYAFIMELIKENKLKAVKSGRQYIIPKESFAEFMKKNKI